MEAWLEFAAARYNYWIVIVLMMTGLYIVYARGNLVKKVVGLNVFQTSVFIFYITIGKIAGGTAPIYKGADLKKHGGDHGDGYGDSHGDGHGGESDHGETLHDAVDNGDAAGLHDKVENTIGGVASNDLKAALNELPPADGHEDVSSLHDGADKIANDALAGAAKPDALSFDTADSHGAAADSHAADTGNAAYDSAHSAFEYVYTNPLPHVLILTAIVVGVATTAVGLALAVRIREAYGTIEEDELEAIDHIAEFGPEGAGARAGA